ncbi:TPA: hypothetical protein NJ249_004130 [Vibrio parahaemolyticus]|nr:hypothetical protein [Vibrio parahaemolyticus]
MGKFNPFADDVLHAAFEHKEGVVMTVSTAELIQILGGEVEAQMAEESGLSRKEWTQNNLTETRNGQRIIIKRDPISVLEQSTFA